MSAAKEERDKKEKARRHQHEWRGRMQPWRAYKEGTWLKAVRTIYSIFHAYANSTLVFHKFQSTVKNSYQANIGKLCCETEKYWLYSQISTNPFRIVGTKEQQREGLGIHIKSFNREKQELRDICCLCSLMSHLWRLRSRVNPPWQNCALAHFAKKNNNRHSTGLYLHIRPPAKHVSHVYINRANLTSESQWQRRFWLDA